MSRENWVLLALYFAEGKGLSPVQLQKSLFLLGQNYGELVGEDFYQFEPYHYGPFNVNIYKDAEQLEIRSLASIQRRPTQSSAHYFITRDGSSAANSIRRSLPNDAVTFLDKAVKWTQKLSFQQLIRAIYNKYPEYEAHSIFRD